MHHLTYRPMTTPDSPSFNRAAASFLAHFGLPARIKPTPDSLRELYRAFGNLPYENVSKIIRLHTPGIENSELFRTPDEVLEGYLARRLGGTCFSLTQCLASLLIHCGFEAYRVLGDMRHGENIHCAVVVRLAGRKFLCDAGYLVPEPLLMKTPGRSEFKGEVYTYFLEAKVRDKGAYHLHTLTGAGESKWRYRIRDRAVEDREFEHFWSESFSAPMNRQLLLTKNLGKMQVYLHKHSLRLNLPDGKKNRNIRSSLYENISELFGIEARLVEQAVCRLEEARSSQAGRK